MAKQSLDERLENYPELKKRFMRMLDIAESKGTGSDTADEVEELLIEETRKVGQGLMGGWAKNKAEETVKKYRENKKVQAHKKK